MSGEVSYFSRFFVKFVEIIAAGVASAISAYLLAHFGGVLLSSPTPASAPVAPIASEVAESRRAQPAPPAVAAAPTSGALCRRRILTLPPRSLPLTAGRKPRGYRCPSTQRPIRAWPRRSLVARNRSKS